MFTRVFLLSAMAAAATAFAPGAMLPTSTRNVAAMGPTMQRIGSSRPAADNSGPAKPVGGKQGSMAGKQGSMAGKQGSVGRQGSAGRVGSAGGRMGSMTPTRQVAAPVKAVAKAPVRQGGASASATRYTGGRGTDWDINGADWARGGGIFGTIGDVTWAREAEVKHGRICMLAATGAIVQDLYTFPFMDKWYTGEKMWGLHEASIKSGALWQVLFFIGLLEIPFLLKLAAGTVDGTGDIGFDPLGMAQDTDSFNKRQVTEVKNGRLAMIAISGMTHHYFLTGKGPIEFITQIPNFKSCAAAAVSTQLCR